VSVRAAPPRPPPTAAAPHRLQEPGAPERSDRPTGASRGDKGRGSGAGFRRGDRAQPTRRGAHGLPRRAGRTGRGGPAAGTGPRRRAQGSGAGTGHNRPGAGTGFGAGAADRQDRPARRTRAADGQGARAERTGRADGPSGRGAAGGAVGAARMPPPSGARRQRPSGTVDRPAGGAGPVIHARVRPGAMRSSLVVNRASATSSPSPAAPPGRGPRPAIVIFAVGAPRTPGMPTTRSGSPRRCGAIPGRPWRPSRRRPRPGNRAGLFGFGGPAGEEAPGADPGRGIARRSAGGRGRRGGGGTCHKLVRVCESARCL
jgi:hypothetical protein